MTCRISCRQEQTGRLQRDIDDALRRANRLADEEREVFSGVNELESLGDIERMEQLRALSDRKDAMETEVADLERQIDSTSAEFRREEREASQRLLDASNSIRDNKLKEKIRYTKGVIRARAAETARAFEEQITNEHRGPARGPARRIRGGGQHRGRPDGAGSGPDPRPHAWAGVPGSIGCGSPARKVTTRASPEPPVSRARTESPASPANPGSPSDQPGQSAQSGQSGQPGQPGQAGQPGQPGQAGQSGGQPGQADGQPGVGDTFGGAWAGGGYGDRRAGTTVFSPQDARQWQREFRQRLGDAQDIRRLLEQESFEAGDLDAIIEQLQALDDMRVYQDAAAISRLQTYLNEELKRFEYRLRREVEVENEELFLASSDEVPAGFRDLIEEYYRALSRD